MAKAAVLGTLFAAGMLSVWNLPGSAADPENGLTRSLADPRSPERRAIGFLVDEVPRWWRENRCHSCHNNGDAARALFAARQLGYQVPAEALQDTTDWLLAPLQWKENKGDQEFSDQQLADLQFANALQSAIETGVVARDRGAVAALGQAASLVLGHQSQDGSWQIDSSRALGSPATYGRHLATAVAMRVLRSAPGEAQKPALQRAHQWLTKQKPVSVMGAAATLLEVDAEPIGSALALHQHCLQVIRRRVVAGDPT